jgi:hypothetical protein
MSLHRFNSENNNTIVKILTFYVKIYSEAHQYRFIKKRLKSINLKLSHTVCKDEYAVYGSPTKCRSNKRRKYKTSNDKTLKDKTPNGTNRRMEKTPNGTKR